MERSHTERSDHSFVSPVSSRQCDIRLPRRNPHPHNQPRGRNRALPSRNHHPRRREQGIRKHQQDRTNAALRSTPPIAPQLPRTLHTPPTLRTPAQHAILARRQHRPAHVIPAFRAPFPAAAAIPRKPRDHEPYADHARPNRRPLPRRQDGPPGCAHADQCTAPGIRSAARFVPPFAKLNESCAPGLSA